MSDKLKEKLDQYKEQVKSYPIDEQKLNEAIEKGVTKAKMFSSKKKRSKLKFVLLTATFILLVGWIATHYTYDLVKDNKGYRDALDHKYYQPLNISKKEDGMEIVLDGAIVDELGFILFYQIKTDEKFRSLEFRDLTLKNSRGKDVRGMASYSYGVSNNDLKEKKKFYGMLDFTFKEEMTEFDYELAMELDGFKSDLMDSKFSRSISIPFSLDETKIAKSKTYDINKTITLEGQNIFIEKAVVYPLRVSVEVMEDENNTMSILDFPDLRLVDEAGEEWGSIVNGVTAYFSENEQKRTLMLQSNYFKEPKALSLVLSKVQAIDKEEQTLIIDLHEKTITKQPKENLFKLKEISGNRIEFELQTDEEFPFSPFSIVKDEAGNELDVREGFYRQEDNTDNPEVYQGNHGMLVRNLKDQKGKLYIPLDYYPRWIHAEEEVRIPLIQH